MKNFEQRVERELRKMNKLKIEILKLEVRGLRMDLENYKAVTKIILDKVQSQLQKENKNGS